MNDYLLPDLPPCPTEDSDNCIWLASEHGNGEGHSFYTIMGETTYFTEPIITQLDPAPIIYAGLTVVLTIAILLLRKTALKKNRK
jgi:hypothetical protein